MAEQQTYQVRFDQGRAGWAALAGHSDVVVWVDELTGPAPRQGETEAVVLTATAATAADVAADVLRLQADRGTRTSIAVIAAGALRPDGSERFAVEDLLAAGAVVDALSTLGLDHTSPEAAAASAAYTGLARAFDHLLTASVTAQS